MAQGKRYLTTQEFSELIGMSESFLNKDRCDAQKHGKPLKFPYVRYGRTIRYDREALAEIMDKSTVGV